MWKNIHPYFIDFAQKSDHRAEFLSSAQEILGTDYMVGQKLEVVCLVIMQQWYI